MSEEVFNVGQPDAENGDWTGGMFWAIGHNTVTIPMKEEIKSMCKYYVDKFIWRKTKFVRYIDAPAKASLELIKHAQFKFLKGKSKDAKARWVGKWVNKFSHLVARAINKKRSDVTSAIKGVCHDYYLAKGSLPTSPQLQAILERNFDRNNKAMMDLMEWWWDSVIPKVAGDDWSEDKRYYGLLHRHFEEKPQKVFVHTSSEAFAAWTIESNRVAWPLFWEGPGLHPHVDEDGVATGKKLKNEKKLKDDNGNPYGGENQPVSLRYLTLCTVTFGPV